MTLSILSKGAECHSSHQEPKLTLKDENMHISERIRPLAEEILQAFDVPGLVIAVTRRAETPAYMVVGTDAAGFPLSEDTLFPVASITKLAVALAVLRLADGGALDWRDSLARYLPDAASAQPGVTLCSLLTHTSGLPSSYPEEPAMYKLGLTWSAIAKACLRTALVQPPDTSVVYSGVGYSLLAVVVERITRQPFAAALTDLVFVPLGIEAYLGVEPPRTPAVIDVEDSLFTGTPLEFYNSAFFRTLGEPAGGLLTTPTGVLGLVGAYQSITPGFLQPDTAAAATRNQIGSLGGGVPGWFTRRHCPWGLGPALYPTLPGVPVEASSGSFGRTGATGCLVWCDPAADITWALLGTKIPDNSWCDTTFPQLGTAILASLNRYS
jgi:CubicO group peptidase (beta-lactamase class C family)